MAMYDFPPPESLPPSRSGVMKAHALYDFDGQPGTEELSIKCGEVLTVTNTNIGEGWWEGQNAQGQSGLFPEAYVEEVSSDSEDGPPNMAPPPLPPDYTGGGSAANAASSTPAPAAAVAGGWSKPMSSQPAASAADDDWGNAGWGLPPVKSTAASSSTANGQQQQQQQQQKQESGWNANDYNQAYDDDWDSDFDDQPSSSMPPPAAPASAAAGGGMLNVPKNSATTGSSGDVSSIGRSDSKRAGGAAAAGGRTSFNRFSTFVKSGGENYVLGKLNANVQESDVVQVVDNGNGTYSWLNAKEPYSCSIASPKKESKMHGLKSFVAYQLTPSFNNIQVSRRYKHFDWLHERLVEKYTCIPIPPLPDKQIQGRYEKEFLDHRMLQLQNFVDRVCKHPILSQSEVWEHFLTCTDEKRWKSGKRKAEKDPLVGGSMFMAIRTPDKSMDQANLEHQVSVFTTFTNHMDSAVKNLQKTCADQTAKCQSQFMREHQTVGKAFGQLGAALQQDGINTTVNLTNAITTTGENYEEIGKMFEEQPKMDWERLGDVMHEYRGMLGGWPGVLQIHAGAVGKRREFEKLSLDGKIGQAEALEIGNRTDTLSYALLAEINTFHMQKYVDMKKAHQEFLQEQIKFYQKITEKLQDALRMFDSC